MSDAREGRYDTALPRSGTGNRTFFRSGCHCVAQGGMIPPLQGGDFAL